LAIHFSEATTVAHQPADFDKFAISEGPRYSKPRRERDELHLAAQKVAIAVREALLATADEVIE
jgi:hypothetical protein